MNRSLDQKTDRSSKRQTTVNQKGKRINNIWPKMPTDIYLFMNERSTIKFCHWVKCNKHGTNCRIWPVIEVLTLILSNFVLAKYYFFSSVRCFDGLWWAKKLFLNGISGKTARSIRLHPFG